SQYIYPSPLTLESTVVKGRKIDKSRISINPGSTLTEVGIKTKRANRRSCTCRKIYIVEIVINNIVAISIAIVIDHQGNGTGHTCSGDGGGTYPGNINS